MERSVTDAGRDLSLGVEREGEVDWSRLALARQEHYRAIQI